MKNSSRDQAWLNQRLQYLWKRGFSDVVPLNTVLIRYGRVARTRLGSIRMSEDKKISQILVNRLFQSLEIPLEVVDLTIAHELVHYVHGFSSPFEQKFCTPHAGGVVNQELKQRGFSKELSFHRRWLRENWASVLASHISSRKRTSRPARGLKRFQILWTPSRWL